MLTIQPRTFLTGMGADTEACERISVTIAYCNGLDSVTAFSRNDVRLIYPPLGPPGSACGVLGRRTTKRVSPGSEARRIVPP